MKRATSRKVVHSKNRTSTTRRQTTSANRSTGGSSLYEEIKSRGGNASVCIIRSVGGIGDVLMTTPAMIQLKREFPNLKITYAIDRHRTHSDVYYHLVKNAWFIDEIIDARYVQRGNYHSVADISAVCIRYERRGLPSINRIDLFSRALGIPRLKNPLPFYSVEPDEAAWATARLKLIREAGKKIVFLHTASFEDKRSWSSIEQRKLIQELAIKRTDIHVLVSDFNNRLGDLRGFQNITDVSRFSVREVAALISKCDLFVGPDSGLMHLAGAIKTKSLVIFGSIPPEARINYYLTHRAIKLEGLSCLGCWYEACPIGVKCMNSLSYLAVLTSLNGLV